MTRRGPAAMAIVALSLLAVGCNDDEPSADPPTTTESTASTAPESTVTVTTEPPTTTSTTTAAPTTLPPTTSAPTTPTIAPDDWEAILEELARRRVELYAAPDLSRIGEYCAPGSDCAMRLETQLGDAIAKGQHIEGQRPFDVIEILQASIGEQDPGAPAIAGILFVVAPTTPPPARLVDDAGNVVDELALTTTRTKARFTLVAWDDPTLPWRVVLAEDLGPVS